MKAMMQEWGLFLVYIIVGAFAFMIFSEYMVNYQYKDGSQGKYNSIMTYMIAEISGSNADEVNEAKELVKNEHWELVE